MENISTYRGETKTISVTIPSGYTQGYTTTFTLNDREYFDGENTLSISASIINGISLIDITPAQNNLSEGVYFFEIKITDGQDKYIIANGSYTVLPSFSNN